MEDHHYKVAKKNVGKKKGFYTHLAVFISVGIFFFLINIVTMGPLWFFYPMLPWLVGLMIHYFSVFGFPGTDIMTEEWEAREMEKELAKFGRKEIQQLPAEQEEDFSLNSPKKERTLRENWQDDDFV